MSSLPVDTVIPPDPGPEPGRTPPDATRREPLPFLVPHERLTGDASPWALSGLRRALEFSVAAAALLLLMPLLALAAALVWLDSEGPVLFRQQRMGRNGREFTLYKFRSMRVDAARDSCITVTGDSRITRAGAFLRRHKLDELPQFWNVLRGDMSLVGPRPKLPHLEPLHMTCRPGITGAATLAFRHEERLLSGIPRDQLDSFYDRFIKPAKACLDLEYMSTATFSSDIRLLWRTFAACLGSAEEHSDPAPDSVEAMAKYAAVSSPES